VTFDTCPISNLKLQVVPSLAAHPLRQLMQAGVRCTISTDDPLVFANRVSDEYLALANKSGFTRAELAQLARNGWAVADVPAAGPTEVARGNRPARNGDGRVIHPPIPVTEQTYTIPPNVRRNRADKILARAFPEHSRVAFHRSFDAGLVKMAGKPIPRDQEVVGGMEITFGFPDLIPSGVRAVEIPLEVIFEDKHMLAVNKAAGMVVHPGAGTRDDTLVHALLAHCKGKLSGVGGVERPGIVHRLDRETSGVILVAKSDLAHRGLAEQFKERELQKEYLTLVSGAPGLLSGSMKKAIGRNQQHRHKMTAIDEEDESGRGRDAHTDWAVVESFGKIATLMRCTIHTGRTHQDPRAHEGAWSRGARRRDLRLEARSAPAEATGAGDAACGAHRRDAPDLGQSDGPEGAVARGFRGAARAVARNHPQRQKKKIIAAEPVKRKGKPVPPPAHVREG